MRHRLFKTVFSKGVFPNTALGLACAVSLAGPGRGETASVPTPPARPAATVSATSPAAAPASDSPAPKPPEDKSARAAIRAILEEEARKAGLPPDVAEAVVRTESGYNVNAIGSVGEIGLMQVRPGTAAMLGFRGDKADLAKPEINLHYGVLYLAQAWRLANGDLCRALMKYRAGHNEEVMTPLSVSYCNMARGHLAALGSPLAAVGASGPVVPIMVAAAIAAPALNSPTAVYARFKRGTPAASRAFWSSWEARVRVINARIEAKWHRRMASR